MSRLKMLVNMERYNVKKCDIFLFMPYIYYCIIKTVVSFASNLILDIMIRQVIVVSIEYCRYFIYAM